MTERMPEEDDGPRSRVLIGKTWVVPDTVLILEAQGNYLRVVTGRTATLERFRISEAVALMDPELGICIHRSRWVSFAGIETLAYRHGQYRVMLRNGESFAIASTRESTVLAAFAARGIPAIRS